MATEQKIGRFQTPKQVAKLFGKETQAIQRLCSIGSIKHVERVGQCYYIDVYAEWPNLFTSEIEAEKKDLAAL